MHLVEMTFVADDHLRESSEPAAARLPANTEPASGDVLAEQSFPRDEQLRNLFRAMPGHQEASGRVSHDAHLAEVRLRHVGARRQRVYKLQSEF